MAKIKIKKRKKRSVDESALMFGMSEKEQQRRAKSRSCGSCQACVPEVHGHCVWRDGSLLSRHRPDQTGLRLRLDMLPAGTAVMECHDVGQENMSMDIPERRQEVMVAVMRIARIMLCVFYDQYTRFKTLAGPASTVDALPLIEPEWAADKVEVTSNVAPTLYGADGQPLASTDNEAPRLEVVKRT